jgi:TRAP-type C4-dicarboxylate transport system permease large subunit
MLIVIGILLLVGMFVEPLPALFILAPFLAPVAVGNYGIDPVQFGVVVVFSLVLGLIHPPVGLVLFLVSSIAKVSFERLSLTMIPWLAISLLLLIAIALLPAGAILWLADWTG